MMPVVSAFQLEGKPVYCEPYGYGHINSTFLIQTQAGKAYILQKINHHVFKDVPALMHNVAAVTAHLIKADPRPRHVLTLRYTKDGASFVQDENGEYWRMLDFIADSLCLERADDPADFYESAAAFGSFQNHLADFPAETLNETIPHFHDTPERYRQLRKAIDADVCGRAKDVQKEIHFYLEREAEAPLMVDMLAQGQLPLRVTHNDTKLNNVMLDAKTRKFLCVVDLDTVMPGLAANDFGDSIRFGASTAQEDERDLSLVHLSMPLYNAYVEGFLGACGLRLTKRELETLPLGAKLMTLECGSRFLADYLAGDTYFHVARPSHNLDRARTQMTLVADMEAHWQEMQDAIKSWQSN